MSEENAEARTDDSVVWVPIPVRPAVSVGKCYIPCNPGVRGRLHVSDYAY
jgi:hypothetical protein